MKCQNCGKEFTSGNKCPECGAPVPEIDKPEKTKKPITKKWWFWVIIAVVVFVVLASVGGNKNDSKNPAPDNDNAVVSQVQPEKTTVAETDKIIAETTVKNEGDIGDYNVTVKNSKIESDYEGKSVLLVTYSFTNNSDKSASMAYSISDKAFQNGVELSPVYMTYGIDDYNLEDHDKELKPGVALDIKRGYYLNDSETVVNIELSELISFSDDVLKYDIAIK